MKLTKSQRQDVFNKFNGHCAYCGCELQKGWHADHIQAVRRDFEIVDGKAKATGTMINPDLDILDNFNPSCPECNLYKSSMPIEVFRNQMQEQAKIARRQSKNFRFAEKFGLIKEIDNPVVFYFETYKGN